MTPLERAAKLVGWVRNDPPWLYNLRWRWIVWKAWLLELLRKETER
jgi:hypothetical protein